MGRRLVFVGGGHAHLESLKNLREFTERGHRVTLISPSPHHYSGMGPGLLSGIYQPREARFHVGRLAEARGATFVRDRVVRIEPDRRLLRLSSGGTVDYDVASFNTGSDVSTVSLAAALPDRVFTVKPVVELLKARRFVLDAARKDRPLRFVVVGGGPAGLEISANLWKLLRDAGGAGEITLVAGRRLMSDAPGKVRRLALGSLTRRGIRVLEGAHARKLEEGAVILGDGDRAVFDAAFVATGIQPSTLFRESGLPAGADGGLLVNTALHSAAYPDLFGGGDCVSLVGHPLAKVGVHAVREAPVLRHNLLAALEGRPLKPFMPQKDFLLIFNMGDKRGLFWKRNWVWEGRLAFLFKDYIDRRFMARFQVSGERDDLSDTIE